LWPGKQKTKSGVGRLDESRRREKNLAEEAGVEPIY
jgi:hypothetical protein